MPEDYIDPAIGWPLAIALWIVLGIVMIAGVVRSHR